VITPVTPIKRANLSMRLIYLELLRRPIERLDIGNQSVKVSGTQVGRFPVAVFDHLNMIRCQIGIDLSVDCQWNDIVGAQSVDLQRAVRKLESRAVETYVNRTFAITGE